jgi:hypothetical protein
MRRSPPPRRRSPMYDVPPPRRPEPPRDEVSALIEEAASEARSVFVSQLAAKLTSRDVGMFFEDKLGRGSVRDARVVTDRITRRSKGYVHCVVARFILLIPVFRPQQYRLRGVVLGRARCPGYCSHWHDRHGLAHHGHFDRI